MCANCVNTAEAVVAQASLAIALAKAPVHRMLANAGLVAPPDPVVHQVRTVAFLRSLDLDPVALLGADVVDRADRRASAPQVSPARKRSLRPIGSHSTLIAQ